MKNTKKTKYILVAVMVVLLVAVCACLFLGRSGGAENGAKTVLMKMFTATQADAADFADVMAQASSAANDELLLAWEKEHYPDLMTENGYNVGLKNRVFAKALQLCEEHEVDFDVTSVTLLPQSENNFSFTVVVTEKGGQQSYTLVGFIKMVQDAGSWKADNLAVTSVK